MIVRAIEDIELLVETSDIECKAAQGKSGKGELPNSIWETYSAMANTHGGRIYLGIEETKEHAFIPRGIKNTQQVIKSFWDTINNKTKVNENILRDEDVQIITIESYTIIEINIPRAERQIKPIFVGSNPLTGTFVRRNEGDYRANIDTTKRMIAESIEDSRDDRILNNFDFEDLDVNTVTAYRNRFSASKPNSPWNNLSQEAFLERIGAMKKEQNSKKIKLTLAGLLMFGRYEIIKDELPNYLIDYQERTNSKSDVRWIDRVVPDSTWSGNLYDFYNKVILKLCADLKLPFALKRETRIDDTPAHQALREALTNTLIHADYTGRVSILIVKRPDMFVFRNPGLMRVSLDQALHGGVSDCRNHRIQDMFRYIGLGDHAGSGLPTILKSWKSQHWRAPLLYEDVEFEQTFLELRTISLFPEESVQYLIQLFGEKFNKLTELQRVALITAEIEGSVSHSRMKTLCTAHTKDISDMLSNLVKDGFLDKTGETRATVYFVKGSKPQTDSDPNYPDLNSSSPDLSLSSPDLNSNSPDLDSNSLHLDSSSLHLDSSSLHLGSSSLHLDSSSLHLDSNSLQTLVIKLKSINKYPFPKRISRKDMIETIQFLCSDIWVDLKTISTILKRDPTALQIHYISKMLAEGLLELKYPETKNHPLQAYKSKDT